MMFEHYIFGEADPAEHLPRLARGLLGAPSPRLFGQMRVMLKRIFAGGGLALSPSGERYGGLAAKRPRV
jgi:hypothetical protein